MGKKMMLNVCKRNQGVKVRMWLNSFVNWSNSRLG